MTRKKVWRYRCDFCRKAGCSAPHMVKHEKHCTMNPARECRFCKASGNRGQRPLAELVAAARNQPEELLQLDLVPCGPEKELLDRLMDMAHECPACVLAAARQAGVLFAVETFDYRKEVVAFWAWADEERERRDIAATLHAGW